MELCYYGEIQGFQGELCKCMKIDQMTAEYLTWTRKGVKGEVDMSAELAQGSSTFFILPHRRGGGTTTRRLVTGQRGYETGPAAAALGQRQEQR